MKITSAVFVLICLFLLGCQDSKQITDVAVSEEILLSDSLDANYPTLQVYMSKADVRMGSIGISFPITENKSSWNRLSLGISGRSYDTRIEFLEKLPVGDRYRITIYEPVSEDEELNTNKEAIYDETLTLTSKRKDLIEIEGVQFYTEA